MKNTTKHITLYGIRIFLMVFWLYVALDKLWNLSAFHSALIRQPFPDWWADILFLLLPLTELGLAILFIANHPSNPRHSEDPPMGGDVGIWNLSTRLPYILSAAILVIFNIYIALGVAGLYADRPCGCASILSGLSWGWHLLVNLLLLGLSILGWYLTGPTTPMVAYTRSKRQVILFIQYPISIIVPMYRLILVRTKVFKRRFAPFPASPVLE